MKTTRQRQRRIAEWFDPSHREPALAGLTQSAMLADQDFVAGTEPRDIVIPCRGMARLNNVRGMTLRVMHGSAWITQSDSVVDVSLEAGESFCVTRSGRTLVAACHNAPFTVVVLEQPVAVPLTLGQRLRRLLFALNATPSNTAPSKQPPT